MNEDKNHVTHYKHSSHVTKIQSQDIIEIIERHYETH